MLIIHYLDLEPDILKCEVKRTLGSITTNKDNGGDGIPTDLFQILKDDVVKVLYSICQQIWKTQQWPQDWKRPVFIPIPKKENAKDHSNYHMTALMSHVSRFISVQLLSHLTLRDTMDCSTPGLPVHYQLLEFTQTNVHWVGDALISHASKVLAQNSPSKASTVCEPWTSWCSSWF